MESSNFSQGKRLISAMHFQLRKAQTSRNENESESKRDLYYYNLCQAWELQGVLLLGLLLLVFILSSTYLTLFIKYGTRQVAKNDIFLTWKNTLQYGIRSVRHCGAKCWNDISVGISKSLSPNIFRQKLKAFLYQNHCKS